MSTTARAPGFLRRGDGDSQLRPLPVVWGLLCQQQEEEEEPPPARPTARPPQERSCQSSATTNTPPQPVPKGVWLLRPRPPPFSIGKASPALFPLVKQRLPDSTFSEGIGGTSPPPSRPNSSVAGVALLRDWLANAPVTVAQGGACGSVVFTHGGPRHVLLGLGSA